MDLNKITPLSRTPPTKEKERLETTKVLDDYYSEKFFCKKKQCDESLEKFSL